MELRDFYKKINEDYDTAISHLLSEKMVIKVLVKDPLRKGMEKIKISLRTNDRAATLMYIEDLCVLAEQLGFLNYAGVLEKMKETLGSGDLVGLGTAFTVADKICEDLSAEARAFLKEILG